MENQSGANEGGKPSENLLVADLKALLTKPKAAAAAPAAGSAASNGEAAGEEGETTTTTEGAGAPEVTDSPAGGSEETAGGEGEAAEGDEAEAAEGTEGEESTEETEGEEADVPKAIKELQKRVGKLTARAKAAEEESDRLRAQMKAGTGGDEGQNSSQRDSTTAAGVDPRFAQDKGLLEVAAELKKTDNILAAVEEALESGDERLKIGEHEFTRAELRAIRRNAEGQRVALTTKRESRVAQLEGGFQRVLEESNASAVKMFPWMANAESAEFQEAVATLKSFPALGQRPDRALILGDYIEGRKARLAKAKGAAPTITKPAAGKPGTKPAPVPSGVRVAAPKADVKKAALVDAETKFQKSGRVEDLPALLKARKAAVA